MNFIYCERCFNERKGDCECRYNDVIIKLFGEHLYHQSCPDQETRGKQNVDLIFRNRSDEGNIIEVEHKTVIIGFEGINTKAFEVYNDMFENDILKNLTPEITLLVHIQIKRNLTDAIYRNKIQNELISYLNITDFDNCSLPQIHETKYYKISIGNISGMSSESHLLFYRTNPIHNGKPSNFTFKEVDDVAFDFESISSRVIKLIKDAKIKMKYKIENSKKVLLIVMKYEIRIELSSHNYDKKMQYHEMVIENIRNSFQQINCNFYDDIIVYFDSVFQENRIYFKL